MMVWLDFLRRLFEKENFNNSYENILLQFYLLYSLNMYKFIN